MSFLYTLVPFVLVALLSGLAVELGFAAEFVTSAVGYSTTAYVAALASLLTGQSGESAPWFQRRMYRVLVGIPVALGVLWLLRGPLLFHVLSSDSITSGHSPFLAFLICNLSVAILLGLLARVGIAAPPSRTSEGR